METAIPILSEIGSQASERIHCAEDAETLARLRLPKLIHDFISAGAGAELATAENSRAFGIIKLQARVLRDVSTRSLETKFLAKSYNYPFGFAPMGMCNLAHPEADAILARLARQINVPVCLSTAASTSMEDMIAIAGENTWFQLYAAGDPNVAFDLVRRADTAGFKTLIFTVDVPEVNRRLRDIKNGFEVPFQIGLRQAWDFARHPRWSLTTLRHGVPKMANFQKSADSPGFDRTQSRAAADWEFLSRLRDLWPGQLVVKGVTSADDAHRVKSAGVDGIYVSNHGGRQLDSSAAAIAILPAIRAAVGPDYPLCFDSGIRSGEDIVKAIACGADFVMLGRPLLFALAAEGERGLASLLDIFAKDISLTLAQIGVCDVSEVGRGNLFEPQKSIIEKTWQSLTVVGQHPQSFMEA
ncbi:MAG: alpha-hydroxy acid oxidase [Pseudomonadota bacterium]